MAPIGWQRRPGTPKDAPPTRDTYAPVEETGTPVGMTAVPMGSLQRVAGSERGAGRQGEHDRAQRLWDYVDRLRQEGKVRSQETPSARASRAGASTSTSSGDENAENARVDVYGTDVSTGEDRKLRRGFDWLQRLRAKNERQARDAEADER